MKITLKAFLALFLIHQSAFGASNSVSSDVLTPNSTAFDITFTDDTTNKIYINKTYIEVAQVVKEIEKIANALVPRDITVASCSSTTGCPLDSVQCDAVTETPYCPDGSTLNTVRDMCQKDPDVFSCPTGFTYDSAIKQCVKPLDCPNGGTYVVSRNRCEYKRIYECPAGYTQSGNTCIAPPVCPNNATFDATLLKCTLNPTFQCADAGWTYDPATNKCFYAPPTCPSGGSYDNGYDKCIANAVSTCPSGYTYDNNYKMCISNPNCSAGDYDPVTKKCLLSYMPICATGYTYNSTRLRCEKIPDCPIDASYNSTTNRCEQNKNSACLSVGGDWNGNNCSVVSSYDAVLISSKYTCPYGGVLSGNSCLKTSYVSPACPSGYSLTGDGRCYITSTCSLSGQLDNNVDMCWLDFSKICSSGTYDASLDKCSLTTTCASSGTLNQSTNLCTIAASYGSCSAGYSFDNNLKLCTSVATCTKGILNTSLDRCEQDYIPVCGTGWTFNSTTKMCEKDPVCIIGTYSKSLDKCVTYYAKTCPSGFTLNTTTNPNRCEAVPNCTAGTTYNGTTDTCEVNPICAQGTYSTIFKKCLLSYTPTCASGYTYVAARDRCEKTPPDCPAGTAYNATTNRCEQGSNSACTAVGGTWNGSSCTVDGTYSAIKGVKAGISYVFATSDNCGGNFTGYYATTTGTLTNGIPDVTFSPQNGCGTASMSYSGNSTLAWTSGRRNCTGWYRFTGGGSSHYSSCTNNISFNSDTCTISNSVITYGTAKVTWTNTITDACSYTCPNGGTLSGTTCINQTTVAPSCPTGYTHDGSGRCYANPTCPSSGSFDGNLDVCYLAYLKSCPAGMIYDNSSNACIADPTCSIGTMNTSTDKCGIVSTCSSGAILDTSADKCALAFAKVCTSGTTFDATNDICSLAATCDGGTLNITLDKCQISRDTTCAQGVKDPVTGKCTFTATCQSGSTLTSSGCNTNEIPLTCPSGTDATLDVCYSDVDACKVNSTYPSTLASTLTYSDALNICIVDENIVCASSLTWSANYLKCEAVPICYNGMYNPENDFCYISTKACPINAAYSCKGPIGNQWCSPYECNPTTNQCGYAECPGGIQPSLTAEMNPKYNANLVYNATDTLCTDAYCNLANSSRFTYCGLEASCPSGFGVFEQNGQCFVRECPQDSFQENNKCYSLGCPKGTTEQGSGKCLVN